MRYLWLASVLALIVACGDSVPDDAKGLIKRSDYGEQWPFTVESGYLECQQGSIVTFTADGIEYGVNGTALSRGYKDIVAIWAEDPSFYEMAQTFADSSGDDVNDIIKQMGEPTRINIGLIIKAGLERCK